MYVWDVHFLLNCMKDIGTLESEYEGSVVMNSCGTLVSTILDKALGNKARHDEAQVPWAPTVVFSWRPAHSTSLNHIIIHEQPHEKWVANREGPGDRMTSGGFCPEGAPQQSGGTVESLPGWLGVPVWTWLWLSVCWHTDGSSFHFLIHLVICLGSLLQM